MSDVIAHRQRAAAFGQVRGSMALLAEQTRELSAVRSVAQTIKAASRGASFWTNWTLIRTGSCGFYPTGGAQVITAT